MVNIPEPKYNYDSKLLVSAYSDSLKEVQNELNTLILSNMQRKQLLASEASINQIISDLNKYSEDWAQTSITKAATEGNARTLYSLGLANSYEEALKLAQFNTVNKRFVATAVADTQADLLALTQNIDRQSRLAIRRATAEATRSVLTRGNNATEEVSREIRNRIVAATDVAIIDSAGRRWKVANYADMVARTNLINAHREASINAALEEGSYYGRISNHGAKDACSGYESKIVKLTPDAPGDFPYYGDLPRSQVFHPRCRHVVTAVSARRVLQEEQIPQNTREEIPADLVGISPENATAVREFDRVFSQVGQISSDEVVLKGQLSKILKEANVEADVFVHEIKGSNGRVSYFLNSDQDIKTNKFEINSSRLGKNGFEKTVYHEYYHSRYNKLNRGNITDTLFEEYEETATELAANFMATRRGDKNYSILAYPDKIAKNAPILKHLKEFEGIDNLEGMGENFMKYRFDDKQKSADWTSLSRRSEAIKENFDYNTYYEKNYHPYIRENFDEVTKVLSQHFGISDLDKVKTVINKQLDNPETRKGAYYGAITYVMDKIGVK